LKRFFPRCVQRQLGQEQEKNEPIWDRDGANRAWEDGIIQAAIEQERQRETGHREERKGTQPPAQEREPQTTPPPGLNRTNTQIWVAYHQPGRNLRDALEDRGLILSRVDEKEADRLNRWERQRLKELAETIPTNDNQRPEKEKEYERYQPGEPGHH
jgi:hypothetical protein